MIDAVERIRLIVNHLYDTFSEGRAVDEMDRLDNGERLREAVETCVNSMHEVLETADVHLTTYECKLCHRQRLATESYWHDGGWVGKWCCWDERLRSTE